MFLASVKDIEELKINTTDDLRELKLQKLTGSLEFFMVSHAWTAPGKSDDEWGTKLNKIIEFSKRVKIDSFWMDAICLPKVKDKKTRSQFNYALKMSSLYYATKETLYLDSDEKRLWVWFERRMQGIETPLFIDKILYSCEDVRNLFHEKNMIVNSDPNDLIKISQNLIMSPRKLFLYSLIINIFVLMLSIIILLLIDNIYTQIFCYGVLGLIPLQIMANLKEMGYNCNSRIEIALFKLFFNCLSRNRQEKEELIDIDSDDKIIYFNSFYVLLCSYVGFWIMFTIIVIIIRDRTVDSLIFVISSCLIMLLMSTIFYKMRFKILNWGSECDSSTGRLIKNLVSM